MAGNIGEVLMRARSFVYIALTLRGGDGDV